MGKASKKRGPRCQIVAVQHRGKLGDFFSRCGKNDGHNGSHKFQRFTRPTGIAAHRQNYLTFNGPILN